MSTEAFLHKTPDDIQRALKSAKLDAYLVMSANYYLNQGLNPESITLPCLARLRGDNVAALPGESSRIGNIAGLSPLLSQYPELVDNPDVFYLEASR